MRTVSTAASALLSTARTAFSRGGRPLDPQQKSRSALMTGADITRQPE